MKPKDVKPVRFGDQIEIEIDSMAFGGDAVGRYENFAVFVKGALPGERVLAQIVLVKDQYAAAKTLSILRASDDRVEAPCPIFEECGGCQWQHFNYSKQLQTKTQFVQDALERIGKLREITVLPCLPSPSPYAYRNKALPVLSMREGHFVSGIYEPRSHQLVPYKTCLIQGDLINDLIQRALEKIDLAGLTPYQEKSHTGFLRHLGVRQGSKTGELLLAFVTRTEVPEEKVQKQGLPSEALNEILPRIARELMAEVTGLVGVLQNVNPSRTNIVFGSQTRVLEGRDHCFEIIDGYRLKVSLQSFLQVNTAQADQLHEVVRKALGDPLHKKKWGTALDLYSGIGTLALAISEKVEYVIGVEEIAPAVADAQFNAQNNHRSNLDFVAGDVAETLLDLKKKGLVQIDAAILDPPRKGVSPEVLAQIAVFHPERLVYVSCDPSTLARDLALLAQQGFRVEWAQPLDMFPQTYHVETVVRLTRDTPLPPDVSSLLGKEVVQSFRLPRPPAPEFLDPAVWKERSERWGITSAKGLALLGHSLVQGFSLVGRWIYAIGKFLTHGIGMLRDGGKAFWREIQGNFKKRSEKKAYEKALKEENFSQAQLLANAIRLADLELQLKNSLASAVQKSPKVKAEKMVESSSRSGKKRRLGPLFNKSAFKIQMPDWRLAPLILFLMEQRVIRLVLAAVFLTLGGYIATATLVPYLNRPIAHPSYTQLLPDMIVEMPHRDFLRYQMVPFNLKLLSRNPTQFEGTQASVMIYYDGEPVTTVGETQELILRKDPSQKRLYGNWPIPYNPRAGTYLAELTVTSPGWKTPKVLRSAFTIPPLRPSGLYPGYCALTMEGGKQLINGAVPAIDGSDSMSASNAIGWTRFMGANCFCYLTGQTSIWDHFQSRDFPFNPDDMDVANKYARAAHEQGVKFAAYITTFKVEGDAWNQAPYQFALGYDPDSDQVIPTRFISIEDPKRRQDVIDILKKFNENPLIDIIGLDYVRTGTAGFEMVDEFMNDLNVPAPINYGSMTKEDRIHWLAETVTNKKNQKVVSLFNWWRAHKVALAIKSILDAAQLTKPVFTFSLGWQEGHQHGQDPAMFVDAGVSYNQIMLYQGDRGTLQSMDAQWPEYLSRSNGMYSLGEMVDFNWVQKSLNPPGPEELYRREMDSFDHWFPVNARLGMFWHDLYRIVYGIRGPYSAMEWTLAGAKAFTDMKNAEGVLPIKVSLIVPQEIPAGVAVPINVEVSNESNDLLKGLTLHQLDTSRDYDSDLTTVGPFDLPAGHTLRFKNLFVTIPRDNEPERDNRYMTAVLVDQSGTDVRAFDFVYVHRLGAQELYQIENPLTPAPPRRRHLAKIKSVAKVEEGTETRVHPFHAHSPSVEPTPTENRESSQYGETTKTENSGGNGGAGSGESSGSGISQGESDASGSSSSGSSGQLGPESSDSEGSGHSNPGGSSPINTPTQNSNNGNNNTPLAPGYTPSGSSYDSQLIQRSILEQLPQ